MAKQPKIKRGDVIRADWLNRFIRIEQALGWGSGQQSGGKLNSPGVQFFKAQEDFTSHQDVYRGDAKLWWYDGSTEYAVHNDAITVYSHADDVAADDIFSAVFNIQSGRWEKVSGGGCTCKEIWRFTPLAPSAGTWDADITVNSSTETLTFDWNTTAAQMETELLTHTELTSGDVSCEGGPFPTVAIYVIWAITDTDIQTGYPAIDESSLTGNVVMDKFSTNSL